MTTATTTATATKGPDSKGWFWGTGRRKTAIARVRVRPVAELTAYDVLWPNRVLFTRPAFEALLEARKN